MANSVNRVTLVGSLGHDPAVKTLQNGSRVATFSVATSERWKDRQSGENRERTEWHNISTFNEGLVTVAERFLKKGTKVYVEGKLQTRKWQDRDGQDRYTTEVVLPNYTGAIIVLSGGLQSDGAASGSPSNSAPDLDDDSDIPF